MNYRHNYNPKLNIPSFALVVTRYILPRALRSRVANQCERLVWANTPAYHPAPTPVHAQAPVDWAMMTIDRRDEPEECGSQAGLLAQPNLFADASTTETNDSAAPNAPRLLSIDDDMLSIISSLDLADKDAAASTSPPPTSSDGDSKWMSLETLTLLMRKIKPPQKMATEEI